MKLNTLHLLILFSLFIHQNYCKKKAFADCTVVPRTEGRTGDTLLCNIYALYIWHEYKDEGIRFLTKQFPYLSELQLSQVNSCKKNEKLEQIVKIDSLKELDQYKNTKTSLLIPLKFSSKHTKNFSDTLRFIKTTPSFARELYKRFKPIGSIEIPKKPAKHICIAVHVRKGGGFDASLLSKQYYNINNFPLQYEIKSLSGTHKVKKICINKSNIPLLDKKGKRYADVKHPKRFPPEQFYVDQIQNIAMIYKEQPLFVHIFTDDPNPKAIVQRFKRRLQNSNITFSYRDTENKHDLHVLDDLFAMSTFDCLIRPASSYSKIAQILGNFELVIFPSHTGWFAKTLVVDQFTIVINDLPRTQNPVVCNALK